MSLSFGWRANDTRESIWREDTALQNVSAAALEDWKADGDASHLRKYATAGKPSLITFRGLTPDEARMASARMADPSSPIESWGRGLLMCFRIGVDFPDAPSTIRYNYKDADGNHQEGAAKRVVLERGIRMLASEFVAQLEHDYKGIVAFYGKLIYEATYPSEVEKKASSPQSMQTPSSAAESTTATTEPSPAAEVA